MTDNQRWLSRRYIAYRMFAHLWFIGAVWLYFYRLFITDQQVGILDGMAFAIGLLAEIPSGTLADKFGRDKMVKIGQTLAGTGILIQAAGSSFFPFFAGQAILMIGISFVSGADEALFFEKLNFAHTSTNWRKLVTRVSQAVLISSLIANVIGGWLHTINPRIPWILTGLSFIAASLLIWPIKDTRDRNHQNLWTNVKGYLGDIRESFAQFRLPKLWIYVPIIITVQGLFYTTGWGLLRLILLDRFHFSPFLGSIVIATSGFITVAILAIMHKYADRMSEKRVLVFIASSAVVSLLLSLFDIGVWGYLVILTLYVGEHTLYPFMSEILNNNAPEKQRATVLSIASFIRMLPYVGLAPLIGYLNTHGRLDYFLIGWAILICGAILLYLTSRERDAQIKIT